MQKKQWLGLIIAAVVFTIVGLFGALTNFMLGNLYNIGKGQVLSGSQNILPTNDFVAVLPVQGAIVEYSSGYGVGYQHQEALDYIDELIDNEYNRAILLTVNSPGGTVYASDELYLKLLEYKEVTERPIYAYMESIACSGGYYISMAADKIYANRNVMTGSIGVIFSMTNLSELYEKFGIQEINITSGAHKADGAPGSPFTDEAYAIYQSMVDESYDQFVQIIADGRKMDPREVRRLGDGRIYTAKQAKANHLIDEIAPFEDAVSEIRADLEDDMIELYYPVFGNFSFFDYLLSSVKSAVPKSDLQILEEMLAENRNGVLLYHAKIG